MEITTTDAQTGNMTTLVADEKKGMGAGVALGAATVIGMAAGYCYAKYWKFRDLTMIRKNVADIQKRASDIESENHDLRTNLAEARKATDPALKEENTRLKGENEVLKEAVKDVQALRDEIEDLKKATETSGSKPGGRTSRS